MTLDIKVIVIFLMYAIATNLFFLLLSNVAVVCENLPDDLGFDENIGNVTTDDETKNVATDYLNIVLNRCDGFPTWVYWIFQVPTIVGVLYIIRGFLGFT